MVTIEASYNHSSGVGEGGKVSFYYRRGSLVDMTFKGTGCFGDTTQDVSVNILHEKLKKNSGIKRGRSQNHPE